MKKLSIDIIDRLTDSTISDDTLIINLHKYLDDVTTAELWNSYSEYFRKNEITTIIIEAKNVEFCNGLGIAFLYNLKRNANIFNKAFEIKNLRKEYFALLSNFENLTIHTPQESINIKTDVSVENIGKIVEDKIKSTEKTIEFIGEATSGFIKFLKNPIKNIRWSEVLHIMEKSGVDAIFLSALIGFLFGLIMSFQSAIPMQRFGAEIFVANLVSLSLFRELGPLMTAIILAGRTGSSFAAEIGTMKVNEELDALTTMGLNPISYLVLPRLLAIMIVSPLLTIILNFFGLIGSCIVLLSFGYPVVTFISQATKSVKLFDLGGGLFKSIIFGLLIAGIGCISGIQTKEGAQAVGESTTKAVVNGIILISITDGIFSVLYYILGI